MNMQCELNLYSTFLKKVLFQQLRFIPTLSASGKILNKFPPSSEDEDETFYMCEIKNNTLQLRGRGMNPAPVG